MEKTKYDENNGLWYELRGDYYIPCLAVPAQEERPIGIWGRRHLQHQEGAQTPVHGTDDQRQAEYIPCRHQRKGDGANVPVGKADGRA